MPVLSNSALMFGYARPDWRDGYAGWEYLDNIADDNRVRAALRERSARAAAGPIGCAAYDMGRLVGEAVARAEHLTRAGIADGLRQGEVHTRGERVRRHADGVRDLRPRRA